MAEYRFTAALNAAEIPPLSRLQGRSIMIAGLDNRLKDPSTSNTMNLDNNPQNLPQVIYGENVMPTKDGITSVGFDPVQAAWGAGGNADDVYILRDASSNTWYYCPAGGYNYVTSNWGVAWVSTSPHPGRSLTNAFSMAYVNGVSYICYANLYLGHWNGAVFVDDSAALIGIAIGGVRAICGSGNYLIVIYADDSCKWSSLTNPLEFTPSVITGAGSQIPSDLRGSAIAATPTSGGFFIHCYENTIAAVYTQNSAAPWIFREVKNGGGIRKTNRVAKDNTGSAMYVYSSSGLQAMTLRDAENIHPGVTDFLGGNVLETFNTGTSLLSITKVSLLFVKLGFLGSRYLTISYGVTDGIYTQCLIFDNTLKRWGKLVVTHADIFWSDNVNNPKEGMFVITVGGAVSRVILDDRTFTDLGVLILGRYQLNRTNEICSQQLELEVLDANDVCTVNVATNYNGTTVGQIDAMTLNTTTDNYRQFQKQIEGVSLAYIIKGIFHLATALITATKGATVE